MKLLLLLPLLIAVVTAANQLASQQLPSHNQFISRHGGIKVRSFTSRLDHFSNSDGRNVNFSYHLKDDYFRLDGPIYIYVQELDSLTDEFLETGLLHDIAQSTSAALVTANQRFYRSNIPVPNATVENLEFLTIEQTIYDIPYLIEAIRNDLHGSENSRVILFGSGIGATIATWARHTFPHLIYGVLSSSGIYEHSVHSAVPMEDLSKTISDIGGNECANNLNEAFFQTYWLTINNEQWRLRDDFNTCFLPFFWDMPMFFAGITQVLVDYVNTFNAKGIQHLCTDLAAKNASIDYPEFDAYTRWVRHAYTTLFCLDLTLISRSSESSSIDWDFIRAVYWSRSFLEFGYPIPSRSTLWLRCTQLGGFQTTVNSESLFSHVIAQEFYFSYCSMVFEKPYDYMKLADAVSDLNTRYGGKTPSVSHSIYTNGLLDPVRNSGILEHDENSEESYVFNLRNYGKSADLLSVNLNSDDAELLEVKRRIGEIITKWGDLNQ